MDNYTTSETAWKLKEKGFPQPAMNDDQIWYDTDGEPFESNEFSKLDLRHFAFAPTATDILMKRPGLKLEFTGTEWMVRKPGTFTSGVDDNGFDFDSYIPGEILAKHEKPAEACALAYLDK